VLKSQSKVFLTISSQMGSMDITSAGSGGAVAYRVSKAAVNMLSTCFAVDPAVKDSGCKVLCVHPGKFQPARNGFPMMQ
jgi:NAD(P)-dependent dehydrogenase (short-subunit alcohol dehydrogenase family)